MDLFYRTYGHNTQHLIILHGLFGMSDNWVGIARKLAEDYTVIVPDLRNHGNSPNSTDFSFEFMVEDLNQLFEDLGIEYPYLLGHSMGGKLAMAYSTFGEREVDKLIVADMSLKKNTIREEQSAIINSINSCDLSICKTIKEVQNQIRNHLTEDRLVLFVLKNVRRTENGNYEWKMNLAGIEPNLTKIIQEFDLNSKFYNPSLFLSGGNSNYLLAEDQPKILEFFPNAKFQTIEGAGHWLHADKPNEFLLAVKSFLLSN